MSQIFIASDRHGWVMKNEVIKHLEDVNHTYSIVDLGPKHEDTVDPISYGLFIANVVVDDPPNLGIIISKSGNEVMIPVNRIKYARACLCLSVGMAEIARRELNSNILVIPSDTVTLNRQVEIVDAWLETKYDEFDVDNIRKNSLIDIL